MAPPMYSDSPLQPLNTPRFLTGKSDPFTNEASNMTLSHNSFIRGFNSIYQQAPRIPAADKKDFVGYCLAWVDCVVQHHHYEETEFFPALDRAAGQKGLMDSAVDQHAAFYDGLENFKSYLETKEENFDGKVLITIIDSFSEPLYKHLKEEPQQIVDLARYHSVQTPIDIEALAFEAGKKQVSLGFLVNILPVFFLNMEFVEFENGMWNGVFPPVAGPIKWIMTKAAPRWHGDRRWRFAACDSDFAFKQLAF